MNKPKKHTKEFYYWNEIENALNKHFGKHIRDFSNKFSEGKYNPNLPNQDYWIFLLDGALYGEAHNGSFSELFKEEILDKCEEDWQREITLALFNLIEDGSEVCFSW